MGSTEEYRELEIGEIDNLNFEELLEDTKLTYLKALKQKEKDVGSWILLSAVLASMMGIIVPLERLIKNFKNLVSEINKSTASYRPSILKIESTILLTRF